MRIAFSIGYIPPNIWTEKTILAYYYNANGTAEEENVDENALLRHAACKKIAEVYINHIYNKHQKVVLRQIARRVIYVLRHLRSGSQPNYHPP